MRFVLPIAVRIPGFFKAVNPLWPPYLLRDTFRIAQMHGIQYRWPKPDPIVMDYAAGEVSADQPYIHRVTRLGVAAERAGKGFAFARCASHAIWSGEVDNWDEGEHLTRALDATGLHASAIERAILCDPASHDAEVAKNEAEQKGGPPFPAISRLARPHSGFRLRDAE